MSAGPRLPDGAGIDYLALGDSYTIGEGVAPEQRWPVQLAADLRAQGLDVAAPSIIATNGWTTDELSAAIDAADAAGQLRSNYGLVTLGIGVNDQYRGRTLDSFTPAFRMLLGRAIAFAGGDARCVLVPSIPDWGTTHYAIASGRDRRAIARDIDAYNVVSAAICAQRGVAWVDVTTLGRREHNLGLLVDDGLHPSAPLYLQWVARIVPVVLARLGLATHRA
ncbi:SGNH/GDSL hydrolase family protein [soil metagenome]